MYASPSLAGKPQRSVSATRGRWRKKVDNRRRSGRDRRLGGVFPLGRLLLSANLHIFAYVTQREVCRVAEGEKYITQSSEREVMLPA